MWIEVDGHWYTVEFRHDTRPRGVPIPRGLKVVDQRTTTCAIYAGKVTSKTPHEQAKALGIGEVRCDTRDRYDRKRGNHLAMQRAIKAMWPGQPVSLRALTMQFFDAYHAAQVESAKPKSCKVKCVPGEHDHTP